MSREDRDDYEVGYGKPPRSGQFKPGQSGNPSGRKRRPSTPEPKLPSFRPTQKLLRAEAERRVKVRDTRGTYEIPATQAVIRALEQGALKGGVLAQRTYLALQMAEDARLAAEQEEVFSFWEDYKAQARKAIALAEKNGDPLPDLVPHPDDVILDYASCEVRIIGPRNAKEAEECRNLRARLELFYELMIFFGESKHGMPSDDNPVYGTFTFLFAVTMPLLPPRLRPIDAALSDSIFWRAIGQRKAWIAYLNQQLKAVGLERDVTKMQSQLLDFRDLNLRLGEHGFEHYRWPKRRASG